MALDLDSLRESPFGIRLDALEGWSSRVTQLVLIHGVGGAADAAHWMKPLNLRLDALGFDRIVEPTDTICVPSYGQLLGTLDSEDSPETYERPADKILLAQRLEYAARQKALERFVRPFNESASGLGNVPPAIRDPLGVTVEFLAFPDITRYVNKAVVRNAVWAHLLTELPNSGSVIMVAHSLGTVVAAGLLRRLPPAVNVDLFVTVGSPLSFGRYRSHLASLKSGFPYSRVRRWLNVYSEWDPITGGRGLSDGFPQALNLGANVEHTLQGYMSHPAVAAAIGSVAFPRARDAKANGSTPGAPVARRLHRSWEPLMLGTAFTWQLSNSLPSGEWRAHLRLGAAREEVARRAVADIEVGRQRRATTLEQLRQLHAIPLTKEQLDDHPLADSRYPTFRDLTVGAAAMLYQTWDDQELLSLAVGLMIQPLVAPFDIQANRDHRSHALELTLNVVRGARGNLADRTFAEQVQESVEWARDRLADIGRFPWAPVLITTGLVLLAATGVGLMVAAPAGLAGAAVVTSTLAAFGPGGMVGGLITLGAITGTAGAVSAAGVAAGIENAPDAEARSATAAHSGVELAAAPIETLAVTLTGALAVIHAQTKLHGFASTEPLVRIVLSNALDTAEAEHQIHAEVAPDTAGTKLWSRKITLLERALNALDALAAYPQEDALIIARKAIASGDRPAFLPAGPTPQIEAGST